MVKRRVTPRRRGVALLASCGEGGLHMVRTRGAVVVGQVTGDARRVGGAQSVIAVHMALRAEHRGVRPGEGETRRGVVKRRIGPRGGGVALQAGGREPRLHVVRIRRPLEIRQMATDAICVGQIVIIIHVTQSTLHCRVRPRQRKAGVVVIECGICPGCSIVALLTSLRKT